MKNLLSTSQRLLHVFICEGTHSHVHPGLALLTIGKPKCPTCGAEVKDITDTPLGQAYFAFARPDLGAKR